MGATIEADNKFDNNLKNTSIAQDILFRTITFTVDTQIYAIDILYIRDIVLGKRIYRIPNSDPLLIGVTNIRGEILPVFSLKEILGYPEQLNAQKNISYIEPTNDEYLMIIKLEGHLFAIVVDLINKNISVTTKNYNEGVYLSKWNQDTIFIGVIIDNKDNIILIDAPTLMNQLIERAKKNNF